MPKFDPEVFKSNDIRGTYPDRLNERFAFLLGRVLPEVFPAQRVAVGHDARLSSPALYSALTCGLQEANVQVGALGICATELLYYVVGRSDEFDLGVMVTASHNPPRFNGFKIIGPDAQPITVRNGLQPVMARMEAMEAGPAAEFKKPKKTVFAEHDYVEFAIAAAGRPEDGESLKVVVDAGNGVAGLLWEQITEKTGVKPVEMNFEPDGSFPAHLPDPSQLENVLPLREKVLQEGAALGLAYDGDADRVVAVLGDGHVLDGGEVGAALSVHMFEVHPHCQLAVSMVTSRKALDFFRAQGREPVLVPVGHASVKQAMRADPRLLFAAEPSGHYYYRDFFCCDSALITTLHVLQMAASGRLQSVVRALPGPWHSPASEPSFHFERRDDALSACVRVARNALERFPNPHEIACEKEWAILRKCRPDDIEGAEGIRVDYPTWWFCVRPSGTEPKARLTVEARAEHDMRQKVGLLSSFFEQSRP